MTSDADRLRLLRDRFGDLVNYDAKDPLEPIDPLRYRSPEGDSCLHVAAIRGDDEAIECLLDLGADVNDVGDLGNTALHYARRAGHSSTARLLLARGADPGLRNELLEPAMPGEYGLPTQP